MIVPSFWAEGRAQHKAEGSQRTLRRFGWSDISQEAAQQHADQRAQEALARALSGEKLPPRDFKRPYNGAQGLPIREEIVSRHGEDLVVTRNSYGARCLNTAKALFVDIDFPTDVDKGLKRALLGLLWGLAAVFGHQRHSWVAFFAAALGAWLFSSFVSARLAKHRMRHPGADEWRARQRIDAFLLAHPEWHLRLYRTPAGMRLLAMHRGFDAHEPELPQHFQALGADPLYARMCLNQGCFRARVSAKPWRIGWMERLRPRPGVWPVKPERLSEREAWIAAYEVRAAGFAACSFVAALGSSVVDQDLLMVQQLHDELSRAHAVLPLA
ncbi:hypothetical protein LRH25_18765 [Ideonella azotifigens]|uniref:Transmembrane protein n=1 Tax=Ideonella azotifigens TaxID=513160 RepID=A0ABN1K5D4_9BURK|nr:hypothetical protein [Ideonella azotifigens]MCD2342374.1 hypothetical protein [Ideonella azotifigens]